MAQDSWLWTTGATGDGATAYTQAQVIHWQRQTFCGADNEGVLKDYLNELEVTGTSSPVATNTGGAYVYGFPYNNSASVDTAIPTPASNTRIDRIVLRANWSAQTIRITRIAGTEGTGTPPALVQTDGTTWDIPLAQCSITTGGVITITDEIEFLHPNIAINTPMLDGAVVTLAKMANNSVDSSNYVDGSIDRVHLAADIIDGTKIEDDAIDSEHYVDGSIDTAHIGNSQITQAKIGTAAVGTSALETYAVTSSKIAAGAVQLAHMSADSVDDTKAGNRVPQFYRRQGGSATVWSTQGTTTYTPTAVRMQGGVLTFAFSAASSVTHGITFPVAFLYAPLVFATISEQGQRTFIQTHTITASGFVADVTSESSVGNITGTFYLHWLAIGPE